MITPFNLLYLSQKEGKAPPKDKENVDMKTQAETLIKADITTLRAQAQYKQRGEDTVVWMFTFQDGSMIQVRHMSGRSAYRANGQLIK